MTPSELLILCFFPLLLALETQARPPGEQSGGKPIELRATEWAGIRAAREAARHAIVRKADGSFLAPNPGQRWQAKFDDAGFTVAPDHGKWTWGLALSGASRGAIQVKGGNITHRRDDRITEWFVNGQHGLQQGWTVHRAPVKGGLRLQFHVRGGLKPKIDPDRLGVVFQDGDGLDAVTYRGLKAWDADGRDLPARFKLKGARQLVLTVDDEGARYPVTIDPIAQNAYAKASNTGSDDGFGSSVAVSGNTVVVGAPLESSNATGVNGNGFNDYAPRSGAVYVFVRNGETWTQQAYLKASNTGEGDNFGWSVAVAGNTILVGAYQEDSNATNVNGGGANNNSPASGAAYVFTRSGTSWTQQAYLKASNAGAGDLFGSAVALAGDTAIIGANREASQATGINGDSSNNSAYSSGAAYVFVRSGTTWTQQAYVKASDTAAGAEFGSALGFSGDSLIVGAPLAASGAGAAYVFTRSGVTWIQQARLQASNSAASSWFGQAVAISGDTVVAGAPGEASNATGINGNAADTAAPGAGAAYAFTRSAGTWTQQAYLKASNTAASDGFGRTLALEGPALVVGAPGEDSAATGTDGNQGDNTAASSGAVYAFCRVNGLWGQYSYLKASNTGAGDEFGKALALSSSIMVVGASRESGNAFGVQGVQSNNLAPWSGAAYLFSTPAMGIPEIAMWHLGVELSDGGPNIALVPAANGSSVICSVRIRNNGTEPLVPGIPVMSGADAERFSINAANLPEQLAGGQEATLVVTFSAPSTGSYQAMLNVPSNDADESPFNIPFSASTMTSAELYATWAAAEGLTGLDAPATAVPFHDGVPNLLKYAFNLDGDHADVRALTPGTGTAGLPVFRLVGSGEQAVLHAEYLRRVGSGLTCTPKVSTTLEPGSFVPMTGTVTVAPLSLAWERVIVEEPCNPATTPRIFGVVEVTLP
ncbi:hypothetical protein OKA05_12390 [Luteolibacter arcticus]|uniref:FG-GAP repeat-containing protein n=1 Tax=Luteolibacter arcticus TaxID=1581411 RepID=A0ABT3GIL5_9BACT|nr:hypothetical protein [Luteolibacter arcticus]MCW1923355.1 hypothetical protein [Luteolibacter arcticus]